MVHRGLLEWLPGQHGFLDAVASLLGPLQWSGSEAHTGRPSVFPIAIPKLERRSFCTCRSCSLAIIHQYEIGFPWEWVAFTYLGQVAGVAVCGGRHRALPQTQM